MPADLFNSKTRAMFHSQLRRAKKNLPYTLDQLRAMVRTILDQEAPCPYCRGTLTLTNLAVDHAQPLSRAGEHALHNLVVCCTPCNQAKGLMTEEEFECLMETIERWPERARKDLLARLRAGGKMYRV